MSISSDTQAERQRVLAIIHACAANNYTAQDLEVAEVFIRRGLDPTSFRAPVTLTAFAEAGVARGDE